MKKYTISIFCKTAYSYLANINIFLLICIVSFFAINANGQSVWTGTNGTSWTDAGNWTGGVPTATSNVTINNVTNDPVISVAGAVAKSITVSAGGLLTISSSGSLTINNSTLQGILNNGTLNNSGTLTVGNTSTVGPYGIQNNSVFNNMTGGIITIERASTAGINCGAGSTFTNNGPVTVGNAISQSVYIIFGNGSFVNSSGGSLKGTGFISDIAYTGMGGALTPGYSPGKISFFGKENFNNGTVNIEINGKINPGGDFDQIVVGDTATLGGTLALTINFPGAVEGDEIPIFACNGRKDTFDVITGLMPNWFIQYKNTGAILRYGALTETAWIGDSSTVWSDIDNWSNGIPTALTDIFIDDTSTYYPVLTGTGVGKSLKIKTGGSLTINSSGILNIQGSNELGIKNDGTVNNNGIINIGATGGVGFIGLHNTATFNNNSGASIKVDRSTSFGLYNSSGTFTNNSVLEIGGIAASGSNGIWNASIFQNNSGGQIKIDGVTDGAIYNDTLATFNNSASIVIGSISNVGNFGIRNKTSFNNNASASITINRTSNNGIYHTSNTFNNSGTITIGSTHGVGNYGLTILSTFNNTATGVIVIDRAVLAGIINYTTTLTNQGAITIGAINPITTLIAGTSGAVNNSLGGIMKGSGSISSVVFSNNGGTLSPGYSPGLMTFTASENFANSIMSIEVNGNGTAGVNFDRIAVTGTATLGGTLNLNVAYAGAPGDQIQILTASSVSGTFATVTGLPPQWTLDYSATAVTLTFITAGSTSWTGSVSSVWTLAGNWSAGVPISSSDVIISDVANDPVIGSAIAVKSVTMNSGAVLNINSSGSLSINGAALQGLMNNGTVNNSGILNIGSTSGVGNNGLKNNGTFNNNSGSQLIINRSIVSAIDNAGTFINAASISIGNLAASGANGILNSSMFNNNAGGVIIVDRTEDAGLFNSLGGTFTNVNQLALGNSFNVGEYGIFNNGTFNSNVASQLTLNRSTESGIENNGTFTNLTTINIGTIASPGDNGIRNTSTFNNNASGIININRSLDAGINNDVGGTFINLNQIVIGANQSVGQYGLWNSANFTNSGTISIDRSGNYGLWSYLGTFNNQAIINIGNSFNVGEYGLYNNAVFNNVSGSTVSIDRSTGAGIYNFGVGILNNNATINIGGVASVGVNGIMNLAFFNHLAGTININNSTGSGIFNDNEIFTNLSVINIGNTVTTGLYGLRNRDVFENNGGQININRASSSGIFSEAGTISNNATIVIGQLVATTDLLKGSSGSLDNHTGAIFQGSGAVVSNYFDSFGGKIVPGYSAGTMTFTGATNFSNSIMVMQIYGKTTPGTDFDRINVSGIATLGGTLQISNNFPGALNGDQITILTATSVSGTFSNVIGLPANWSIIYNATSVVLTLGPFLPVDLISFNARLENSTARLTWETASEIDNAGFEIERSKDGKVWSKIGFVKGIGNSHKNETYSFADNSILNYTQVNNVFYYRLRQLDINGKAALSEVEQINLEDLLSLRNLVQVYPNPVSGDYLNIEVLKMNLDRPMTVKISDINGSIVKFSEMASGINAIHIDNLNPGVYTVQVVYGHDSHLSKIVVIR